MTVIAVTGGAGFIGSNLVRSLLNLEIYKLIVIDDLSTGLESNITGLNLDFRNVSITEPQLMRKALSDVDTIVHLAARGSVPRSIMDPVATHLTNTLGTLNVLEICRERHCNLIFSSSSSVYGANTALPKSEEMWLQPISPYAASKLGAEAFVSAYSSTYGLNTTLLRFFNVFGPRQRPDHEYAAVLPKWIWRALNGLPLEVHGDGNQTRDFTYVKTVCDIISIAINKKVYGPEVINMAYGNNVSLNEILSKLENKFPKLEVEYLPTRIGDVRNSQNDPTRLRAKFPEVIPVPFDVAFEETYNWLKNLSGK